MEKSYPDKGFWETLGRASVVVFIVLAFGIAVFARAQLINIPPDPPITTYTHSQASGDKSVEHVVDHDCPSEVNKTCSKPNENERELRDLAAQEGMQGAAIGLLLVTVIQGVIGTVGLFFLWDTLKSTRENASAANRTADAAENAERPYLMPDILATEFDGSTMESPRGLLSVVATNFGNSPAFNGSALLQFGLKTNQIELIDEVKVEFGAVRSDAEPVSIHDFSALYSKYNEGREKWLYNWNESMVVVVTLVYQSPITGIYLEAVDVFSKKIENPCVWKTEGKVHRITDLILTDLNADRDILDTWRVDARKSFIQRHQQQG